MFCLALEGLLEIIVREIIVNSPYKFVGVMLFTIRGLLGELRAVAPEAVVRPIVTSVTTYHVYRH